MVVSNRLGARTFNLEEIRRFLFYPNGKLLQVTDDVPAELRHERVSPHTVVSIEGEKPAEKPGRARR